MLRHSVVRLVAVMALAAPWGGCNLDPEVCGYDLEPGPDFSCNGDVLVETMNCPSKYEVMRQDCAYSGERCLSQSRTSARCARTCTTASDCSAGEYCSNARLDMEGALSCEAYVQAGGYCDYETQCSPGLVCRPSIADAGPPVVVDADASADAESLGDATSQGDGPADVAAIGVEPADADRTDADDAVPLEAAAPANIVTEHTCQPQ